MRHGNAYRKFNRRPISAPRCSSTSPPADQARADRHTLPKAKDLRPIVEKLVTLAKRGDLHARRQAAPSCATADGEEAVRVLGPRYASRNGGYTTACSRPVIVMGDSAPVGVIESSTATSLRAVKDSGPSNRRPRNRRRVVRTTHGTCGRRPGGRPFRWRQQGLRPSPE